MPIAGVVLLSLVGAGVSALAIVIIRFNIKRLRIIRAAAKATPSELDSIYGLIESCGSEGHKGFVLARTNEVVDDPSCVVEIPATYLGRWCTNASFTGEHFISSVARAIPIEQQPWNSSPDNDPSARVS